MNYIEQTDNFMASLNVEAYRVGGSVRDEILGRRVKDADYMVRGVDLFTLGNYLTDALPRKAGAVPERQGSVKPLVLRDGRQAGWRVALRGVGVIEVVLPRTDVPREPKPGENRHRAFDIVINESISLAEDAKRRDFTFNALYRIVDGLSPATPTTNVIDPSGQGIWDLQHRMVRTTTPTSFRDDPLRTLRALRFVSVLGYDLSETAYQEMQEYAEFVDGLAASGHASGTVLDELVKVLMGQDAVKSLRLARDTGVLGTLLPELAAMLGFDQGSKYHDLTTDEHTFKALETAVNVDAPLRVRLSLLFHDCGKPASAWVGKDGRKHYYANPDNPDSKDHEEISAQLWLDAAERMNVPKALRDDVFVLISNHMVAHEKPKGSKVRRMRVKLGDDMLRDLYLHRMCDISGKGGHTVDKNALRRVAKLEQLRQEAADMKVPKAVGDLDISGRDVMAMGAQGREIGKVLNSVLDEMVCQPKPGLQDREWQLERAAMVVTQLEKMR